MHRGSARYSTGIRLRAATRLGALAAALMLGATVGSMDGRHSVGAASLETAAAPTIGGCRVFPADNVWNARVDGLAVHPRSAAWIRSIGQDRPLHPDFGSGEYEGHPIGIPYTTAPGDQAAVSIRFEYEDESDAGPYRIPPDAPIESGGGTSGDRHVLVVDRDRCQLTELYAAERRSPTTWQAGSGAIFDLGSNSLRPAGLTSADAAGLAVLPGLVRYDEVAAGEIAHALRFTAPDTQRAYVWPARHFASSDPDPDLPPMGARFRLKSSVNPSAYPAQVRVVLVALQRYGMHLADNGSAWFISGAPDRRWDNDALRRIRSVVGSSFEAVDTAPLMLDRNSGRVRTVTQTDRVAPKITNIRVAAIEATSAIISWSTDEPATSGVRYGRTTAYGAAAGNGRSTTRHALRLTGLTPNQGYHAQIRSRDAAGNVAISRDVTFRTM